MNELEQLQSDVESLLLGVESACAEDAPLQYAAIVRVRPRASEEAAGIMTQIQRKLAGLEGRRGKAGVSITVGMPEIGRMEPNIRALKGTVTLGIQVTENILVNMGDGGTGHGAESYALAVAGLLQHQSFSPWGPLRVTSISPIVEAALAQRMVVYDVSVATDLNSAHRPQCALPALTQEGAEITLTTATEGAVIWWTMDGSYPGPGNELARRYGAAFDLASGTYRIRAAAHKAGMVPSVVRVAEVTVWSV